jgi:hypothetical protein
MKTFAIWSSVAMLSTAVLRAQADATEQLKQQLKQANEAFDKAVQEHRRAIEDLARRLQALEKNSTNRAAPETATAIAAPLAAERPDATNQWSPTNAIGLARQGPNYLNISLDALFAVGTSTEREVHELQLGGHDPNQRGFSIQNVEAVLDGAVDPYFRGQGNVVFFLDRDGESQFELEEAFLESLSLPANLQFRAGQYLTEFGRHNPTHPHTWSFVDAPLVNARFLGPDGLRNPGARLSWLAPTPFYSELFFSAQNSHGETASSFRSEGGHAHGEEEEEEVPFAFRHADNDHGVEDFGDLLYSARYAVSFDVTDDHVVLLGGSAAFGPNSRGGEEAGQTDTQIYGVDLTWKWKSPRHSGGFPFVAWQTEAMLRRSEAGAFDWAETGEVVDRATGLPALLEDETLTDYGLYSQLSYGFKKGWVGGARVDYVTGERGDYEKRDLLFDGEELGGDPLRARRWRLSPSLTWYPTEFSKFRLQYNYDDRRGVGVDHSVWLQVEFVLGAHAAHKF